MVLDIMRNAYMYIYTDMYNIYIHHDILPKKFSTIVLYLYYLLMGMRMQPEIYEWSDVTKPIYNHPQIYRKWVG